MDKLICWIAALALVGFVAGTVEAGKGGKPKKTAEEKFAKADTNGDKKLSLDEFIGKRTGEKKTKAESQFSKRDKDGDTYLSLEEFTAKRKNK